MATKIGFIGLGNMGGPMAANLLQAGYDVAGYDVQPALLDAFAGRRAYDLRSVLEGAAVVITMLPAGSHVRSVLLGEPGSNGALSLLGSSGALLIDSSTIDVDTARAVCVAADELGLAMLDAPVSGGVGGAVAGTLTFMVGGAAEAFTRAEPVLRAMGRTIVHAGESGAGQAAKICNNMLLAVSMLGVSEAFVLADRLGLDRQKLFDISSTATGQCWALNTYCPAPGPVPTAPSNRDYAPGFAAALMLKDLKLAQQAAAATEAATPLGAHAMALYQQVVDAGEGGQDFSVVFRFLAAASRAALVTP